MSLSSSFTLQPRKAKKHKSTSLVPRIVIQVDEVPLREETVMSKVKFATRKTRAKSFGHDSSNTAQDSSWASPRSLRKFPLIKSCIKYLNSTQAFTRPGIFRECGDYKKVQEAYNAIQSTDKEGHHAIFEDIGVLGTADLLKALISRLEVPLFENTCLEKLKKVQNFKISVPQEYVTADDNLYIRQLYVNAILTSLSKPLFGVLSELFSFLTNTIQNCTESKMDALNIATIFAPLVFPAQPTSDLSKFMADNEAGVSLLKYFLDLFKNDPKMLHRRFSKGSWEILEFPKSGEIAESDAIVIRGDLFTVFHRTESIVCGILGNTAHVIPVDEFNRLFKAPEAKRSPSLLRRICKTPRSLLRTY